jgi:integrase/recombinase XerD
VPIPAGAERSFGALLRLFVEDLQRRRYSQTAQNLAGWMLPRFFQHLEEQRVRDVRSVSEAHIVSFLCHLARARTRRGRPLSEWTRRTYLATLRRFFAFLAKRGWILDDPARGLTLPDFETLPRRILTEAQARRLVSAPSTTTRTGLRDRAILETLYGTGIRVGECARLQLQDLDLSQGALFIRNGKGKRDRLVPVGGRALLALDAYLRQGRPQLVKPPFASALFVSAIKGGKILPDGIRQMVRRMAKAAGIAGRMSPHVLRHTCATHLLRGGADVRHVQALLGHRSIETTAVYTRVDVTGLREVLLRSHPRERRWREAPARKAGA